MNSRLLLLALLSLLMPAFAGETQITHADGKQAVKLVNEKKVVVVDVRTPTEFSEGHIEGAKNIDFNGADFEAKLKALSKDQPVLVHCAHGGRSTKSLDTFKKLGFAQVIHLDGGYAAYQEAKGGK